MSITKRSSYWDNLKFILISLVVAGHFIEPLMGNSHVITVIRDWIYLFHMPAFIFISGVFSKKIYTKNDGFQVDTVIYYFSLFALFLISLYLWRFVVLDISDAKFSPFVISGIPWYLLALAALCFSIPFFSSIKGGWKTVIPLLVVLALAASLNKNFDDFLAIGRIVAYAPFFYAGFFVSRQGYENLIEKLKTRGWVVFLAVLFLLGVFVFQYFVPTDFLNALAKISTGRNPFAVITTYSNISLIFIKILWYVLAATMIFAVSLIVSTQKTLFSELGSRTLQVYLLHPLIYYSLSHFGFYKTAFVTSTTPYIVVILIFSAIVATALLALPKAPDKVLKALRKIIRLKA